jgi:hypothetical protein
VSFIDIEKETVFLILSKTVIQDAFTKVGFRLAPLFHGARLECQIGIPFLSPE